MLLLLVLWSMSWLVMIILTISADKMQTFLLLLSCFSKFVLYNLNQRLHVLFFCKRGNISSTKFPKKKNSSRNSSFEKRGLFKSTMNQLFALRQRHICVHGNIWICLKLTIVKPLRGVHFTNLSCNLICDKQHKVFDVQ
jgi:hypothetical protein